MKPMHVPWQPQSTSSSESLEDDDINTFSESEEVELPVDIARQGDYLIIRAPLVGAKNEDISITVNNDILFIHKNNYTPEEKLDNYYVRECHWGPLAREIQLPVSVDPTGAKASLADGILKIVLPIMGHRQTRIIKIR
ncbi:MAG: Hsp20/alpha crystallin family protein [Patescibacteria group bacterium]|jgi:HSP20 family protein